VAALVFAARVRSASVWRRAAGAVEAVEEVDCVDWQALNIDKASRQVAILIIILRLRLSAVLRFIADGLYNYHIYFLIGKYDLC
jgi:hypothetical protein